MTENTGSTHTIASGCVTAALKAVGKHGVSGTYTLRIREENQKSHAATKKKKRLRPRNRVESYVHVGHLPICIKVYENIIIYEERSREAVRFKERSETGTSLGEVVGGAAVPTGMEAMRALY
ncbi:hypothetical protein QTP88_008742 [Uroleucon formosanum]